MRVLGIDPGLRNLGWGVIDVAGARITHVANGICHSDGAEGSLAHWGLIVTSLYLVLAGIAQQVIPEGIRRVR